jgi:very-short-patch-repair endonuclease
MPGWCDANSSLFGKAEWGGGPPAKRVVEGLMARQTSRETVRKARRLRREMTLPEVLLWRLLRQEPDGLKFRRQHPAGPFVLDFYCPAAKLGIEIDGVAHDIGDSPERDAAREVFLAERGIELVRIPASDVLNSVESVADSLLGVLRDRLLAPPPR